MHRYKIIALAVLAGLLLYPLGGLAGAQEPPAKVAVIIAFAGPPGPAEEALVRGLGGDIKFTYHLVPAIAAAVPEAALDGLRRNPNLVRVELDIEVQAVA